MKVKEIRWSRESSKSLQIEGRLVGLSCCLSTQWLPMTIQLQSVGDLTPCNHLSPVKSRGGPPLNLTVTALRPAVWSSHPQTTAHVWEHHVAIHAQSQTNVPQSLKCAILKLIFHARVINIDQYQPLLAFLTDK